MSLSPVGDKDYQAFDLLAQDEVQFMWPKELKSFFWIHKDILPVCSVQLRLEMTVVYANFFWALWAKYLNPYSHFWLLQQIFFSGFAAM